jgi:S1-C subfamily serine protease
VVLAVLAAAPLATSPASVGRSPAVLRSATSWRPTDSDTSSDPTSDSDSDSDSDTGPDSDNTARTDSDDSGTPALASTGSVGVRGIVDVYAQLTGAVAAGTGIITPGGAVLTCAHVIAGGGEVRVVILDPGDPTSAKMSAIGRVVGADRRHDVAVLRLSDPATGAPIVPPPAILGDSDDLRVGDQVEAVGNAYGSGSSGAAPRVSRGRVTALRVSVSVTDDYTHRHTRAKGMIQIDGQVYPGDSGGPLLDQGGRVVGMDTAGGDHRGWANPIDIVLQVASGHGWLAATTAPAPAPSGEPRVPGPAVDARLDLAPLPLRARLGLDEARQASSSRSPGWLRRPSAP